MRVVLVALAMLLLPGQSWSGTGQSTAEPPPEIPAEAALLAASCSGCHMKAETDDAGFPQIYGRPAAEIRKEMLAFRSGAREGTVMNRIAKGYSEKDIEALADYLAAQGGAN